MDLFQYGKVQPRSSVVQGRNSLADKCGHYQVVHDDSFRSSAT